MDVVVSSVKAYVSALNKMLEFTGRPVPAERTEVAV